VTLDEFIASVKAKPFPRSRWVEHEGFDGLYVRVGPRYICGELVPTIDLANMNAILPGKGAFKKLVKHLQDNYPEYTIHVENVLTQKFQDGLIRMGFEPTDIPLCFYLP
jgi:hypothetical protein